MGRPVVLLLLELLGGTPDPAFLRATLEARARS
jgi:hypothetical protein